MKSALLVTIASLVIGLGSAITYVPVRWVLIDRPKEARIEIQFFNDTPQTLCISEGDWPTPTGTLNFMGDRVALLVGAERFPIRDFDTGYCDAHYGGCVVRVSPGKKIRGLIPYEEFKLPERLRHAKKKLVYPVQSFVCK